MTRKFLHEEQYRGADQLAKLAEPQLVLCGAGALGAHPPRLAYGVDMHSRTAPSTVAIDGLSASNTSLSGLLEDSSAKKLSRRTPHQPRCNRVQCDTTQCEPQRTPRFESQYFLAVLSRLIRRA